MIYEGNDFRQGDGGIARSLSKRFNDYLKRSPLRRMIDDFLVNTLGPVGADRHVAGLDILSWMPVAVSGADGGGSTYYAFAPKQLLQGNQSIDVFRASSAWRFTSQSLDGIKDACGRLDAELLMVYAPTKAHVVFPIVRDRLPAEDVRAFASLRQKDLPSAAQFLDDLIAVHKSNHK